MVNNLKNKKKKKGFTLIELIIVIAIIAILAAFAIPKFGEVRKNAAIKSDIANAKTIANAATYLISEGTVNNDTTGDKVSASSTGNGKIISEYLQNIPKTEGYDKGSEFFVIVKNGNVEVYSKANGTKLFPEVVATTTP
ncbi:prepilin-type N-terminal cleavage/methylation domain-containing protein [Clostridium tertium]|jgi:type IV pilus assembly protein PilA|uniref:prepilin-type N-terminal cleavage/methylation domain-containing protein n=1 Tax=Clostridium tertium TaxID=1559 RepID=UPI00241FD83F|nr:prepilin-type N-terminal cleavage/methylation domain-containing protein [Clostridium tertium]